MVDTTGGAPEPGAAGAEDETHRRFREALERKHGKSSTSSAATGHGLAGGPSTGRAADAKRQRTFRRKSGG